MTIAADLRLPQADPPYGHYALRGLAAGLARLAQRQGNHWLGHRIAIALRKAVLRNRRHIIDGDLWGLKFRWHPLDNVTDRHAFFLPRAWDVEERAFQQKHLPPDGVYVDIGANSGLYSLLALARLNERGTLMALEPNPVMFERLSVNLALNPPRARLVLECCGVAAQEGQFTLNLMADNLGGSSMAVPRPGGGQVTVPCRPLYDLVRQAGLERIDFLKIDIEGYEPQALNPFFAEAPRALWPHHVNIESPQGIAFEDLGYVVVQRTAQNSLLRLNV